MLKALLWFTVANIAFEMGGVFYNAFLPDVAPPDRIGRVSGYGWALGYVGGLSALGLALVGFVDAEVPWFGFEKEGYQHIRATNLLVAGWFAVFSLPLFLWVPESAARPGVSGSLLADPFRRLARTFREIRRYPDIFRLLRDRLTHVAHAPPRQHAAGRNHQPVGRIQRRDAGDGPEAEVALQQHREHAGQVPGTGRIDGADPRMGVGCTQYDRFRCRLPGQVVDEAASTRQEPKVLQSSHAIPSPRHGPHHGPNP